MNDIIFKPIGIVHSPFESTVGMPIQPAAASGIAGTAEVYPEYAAGLKDLPGFSHIILIYYFHLSGDYQLEVKPFLDDKLRGVFATRAPRRPNNIGVSVVKLVKIEGSVLHIENLDIVNGTPLLDIKPYVPEFDLTDNIKTGWLAKSKHRVYNKKSDERFDFYM